MTDDMMTLRTLLEKSSDGQPLRLGDLGGGQGLSQRSGLLLILWYWQKVSPR